MREVAGVGVEYGTEWVIKELLTADLNPVDCEEMFEQSVRDCYPENIQVGWMNLDVVSVMKTMDPTSWRIAMREWIEAEEQEENIVSFDSGSTYYWVSGLEQYIESKGF